MVLDVFVDLVRRDGDFVQDGRRVGPDAMSGGPAVLGEDDRSGEKNDEDCSETSGRSACRNP